LRQNEKEFENENVHVVLVGLGSPGQAEAFRKALSLSFPVICDPDLHLYKAYHLKRMSLFQLASPSLLVKGVKALSQGHTMGMPQGDIYQLQVVFIIDRKGRIRYNHLGRDPADHPSIKEIFAAIAKMKKR
jgi:peroxiredoxin